MRWIDLSIQWHITAQCPNRCKHCYLDESVIGNELDIDSLLKIYENIKKFEKQYDVKITDFVLTGGDPMMHDGFWTLVDQLRKDERRIAILGIPERITNDNIKKLKKYKLAKYQVSLDGMKETHNDIRGKGSFEKTILALKKLTENDIACGVMYTLHEQNREELFELIEYLDKEDFSKEILFSFDLLILEGNAEQTNCQMIAPYIASGIFQEYLKKKKELEEKGSKIQLVCKNKLLVLKELLNNNRDVLRTLEDRWTISEGCYCGISSVAIDSMGNLMPCRRVGTILGNLLDEPFTELFLDHSLMRKYRRREYHTYCSDCKFFSFCRGCSAIAKETYGDELGKDIYCDCKEVEDKENIHSKLSMDCGMEEELEFIMKSRVNSIYNPKNISDLKAACRYLLTKKE